MKISAAGVEVIGPAVWLNCDGGKASTGAGCAAGPAADAAEADPAAPGEADGSRSGAPSVPDARIAPSNGKDGSKPPARQPKGGTKKHEPPILEKVEVTMIPPTGGLGNFPAKPSMRRPDDERPPVPATGGL